MTRADYLQLLAKRIKEYALKEGIEIGVAIARMRDRLKDHPGVKPGDTYKINQQFVDVQKLL